MKLMLRRLGPLVVLLITLTAVQAAPKPNIVFILVDDLGYADLACQGSKDIRTPNIDTLAATGIRFTQAYVTAPQCGPSRAGIMTGLNQARFGYMGNDDHSGLPDPKVLPLMPEVLKTAGYRTGLMGKWHIGHGTEYLLAEKGRSNKPVELLPAERIACAKPWLRGFDEGLFQISGSGYYFPFKAPFNRHPGSHYFTFDPSGAEPAEIHLNEDAYSTDFVTDAALDFIRKGDETPFFLYVAYAAPHTPLQAKQADIEANSHIKDEKRRTFAGMMTCLDANIRRVLDLLGQNGLRENTLIVFLSDNGGPTSQNTSRNDPLTGFKGDVHEGGLRVPCLMSWPAAFPQGSVYSNPISSLDLLPTFAAASGAQMNKEVDYDGIDLMPYLKIDSSVKEPPHQALYWSWGEKKALRVGDYKWLDAGSVTRTQPARGVFNLSQSPVESKSTLLTTPEKEDELKRHDGAYWSARLGKLTPRNESTTPQSQDFRSPTSIRTHKSSEKQ